MAGIDKERWRRISPLLDELLDADEPTRATRLERVRRDDPTLAAEVAALLGQYASIETADFLEGSALGLMVPELAGKVVGSYTLDRTLGAGGMGSVWLAHRSDGRYEGQAAVKFLNLALMDRGGAERFRREGSVLARLQHPHIAHLLDAGVTSGQPYLVLEYVEGEPIDRWCDEHVLGVGARIRLFLQVLAAVSHAHGKLILHRDLKPSNILVTRAGETKLLDFGIAKLLEEGDAQLALTMRDGRAFTPEYAAPEQVQGAEVATASDVYALGVLLYVLLAGAHPTARSDGTPVERMRALVENPPRRLSVAAREGGAAVAQRRGTTPLHLERSLAGDLDNIVAKALKKSPAERYASVDAFAADLLRHLNHQPVSARADSRLYRLSRFVARNRLAVASAASVVIALAAGAAVATWQAIEANQRRVQAEQDAAIARASHDLLYLVYSDPSVSPDAKTMLDRLAKVRTVIRDHYPDPRLRSALLMQLGGRYLELSAFDELLDLLGEIRAIAPVDDRAQRAIVACGFGNVYSSQGKSDEAAREFVAANELLQGARGIDVAAQAECLAAEAQFNAQRGNFERSLALAKQGVALFEQQGRTRDSRYNGALNQLSIGYGAMGDFPRAYASIRKARAALASQGLAGTQKDLINALQEVQFLNLGGKPAAALEQCEALRRDPRVARQTELPRFALDYNCGIALVRLARYDEALASLHAAHDGARAAGQRNFTDVSNYWMLEALVASGAMGEAQARLAATPDLEQEIAAASRGGIVFALTKARIALAQGAIEDADTLAGRALEAVRARKRPTDAQLRGATLLAARTALARNEITRAAQLAAAAVERARAEAVEPDSSASIGEALLLQAQVERAAGQPAAKLAQEALPHLQGNLGAEHPLIKAAQDLAHSA